MALLEKTALTDVDVSECVDVADTDGIDPHKYGRLSQCEARSTSFLLCHTYVSLLSRRISSCLVSGATPSLVTTPEKLVVLHHLAERVLKECRVCRKSIDCRELRLLLPADGRTYPFLALAQMTVRSGLRFLVVLIVFNGVDFICLVRRIVVFKVGFVCLICE